MSKPLKDALPYVVFQAIALGILFFLPGLFNGPWWLAYGSTFAVVILLLAFDAFWLAKGDRHFGEIVVALSVQAAFLILFFGAIYRDVGLDPALQRPSDAIYFSLVTWTTLGYGDFRPLADYRMLAGIEALLGYVYLGLIVGLLGKTFK